MFHKNAFGIDISDASIEAVEITKKLGKLAVSSYSRIELEPGIVENGRIVRKETLVAALSAIVSSMKPRRPSTKNVVLSIPESRTFIHIFQLPSVIAEDHLAESIQYKAEEVIPLSFSQIDFDYQILSKEKDSQEVLYVAAFKDTVNDYHDVVRQAGLNPLVFEPESTSLARALVRDDIFEGALIADIGARTTILTVYDHHGVRYSENIPLAGNVLTEHIAKALKTSLQTAEAMKKEVGLTKKDELARALETDVKELARAINRAITYYQKRTGLVITKVILCGGTSLMPGLPEFLQASLRVTVLLGDPLANIQHNKKVFTADEAVLYATVIGLALRGLDSETLEAGLNLIAPEKERKRIKLLPREGAESMEVRKEEAVGKRFFRKPLFILLGVFTFLLAVFIGVFLWQRARPADTSFMSNQATTGISPGGIEVVVSTGEEEAPSGSIVGRLVTKKVTTSKEFDATGKKSVGRTTTGTITIVNNYSESQSLVATTRFLTPDGNLFRLQSGATVPAGGTVTAEVYADEPETLPEVKPTKLTIPGLSASLQKYIYGELKQTIGSPSGEATAVSDSDITQADLAMPKELTTITPADLGQEITEDELVIPELLASRLVASSTSKKANEIAETFTLTREFEVTALVLPQADLEEKVGSAAATLNITLKQFNQDSGLVTLRVISR